MLAVSWLIAALWSALVPAAAVAQPLLEKPASALAEALVARLEDIEHEYPEAMESVTPEDHERARRMVRAAIDLAAGHEATRPFLPGLYEIKEAASTGAQSFVVQSLCTRLIADIVSSVGLVEQAPKKIDLERGGRVYRRACMTCHGRAGQSQAAWLDPLPPDLTDSDTLNRLRPARVFNAVTFGIHGTAMPAFPALSEIDRWSVAFYVFTLRPGRPGGPGRPGVCTEPHPKPSLAELARQTDSALVATYGEKALACLRRSIHGLALPDDTGSHNELISAGRSR